jgi:putative SOS response-associated peptidase YedK
VCNLYSVTTNIEALRSVVRDLFVDAEGIGNFPPQPAIFPDYFAPIIRNNGGLRELTKVRWGMPSSSRALYEAAQKRAAKLVAKQGRELSEEEFKVLVKMEPDGGTTNVRNTNSAHWRRWLAPEFRCLVPFTSFSEFDSRPDDNGKKAGDTWFAFDNERPLAFFAGIWAPQWESVRKTKEGLITTDLFAFLTCEPNDVVAAVHPKAMPVILTSAAEIETWLTAPWEEAKELQRSLPPGVLKVVSVGYKEDPPPVSLGSTDQPDLF